MTPQTEINFSHLIRLSKRRSYFAGRIQTYNEILTNFHPFMSDKIKTLMETQRTELRGGIQKISQEIRTVSDNLKQVDVI